jgi:lipoate-protein ligase B
MSPVQASDSARLSTFDYGQAVALQQALVAAKQRGDAPDGVWYLEHPPVITWNPGRGQKHLRLYPEDLINKGVALESCDRGGDVTYHGPGQLVGYPVIDLGKTKPPDRDLHAYLQALEEALIVALGSWTIEGSRCPGRTGVWTDDPGAGDAKALAKIAAIGVRVRRWVTCHGFALNVDCDLTPFREFIVPCGISDAGVTSMKEILGECVPGTRELVESVHRGLEASLGRPLARTYNGKDWLSNE